MPILPLAPTNSSNWGVRFDRDPSSAVVLPRGLPFVTSAARGFEEKDSIFVNFTEKTGAEKGIYGVRKFRNFANVRSGCSAALRV